jgi:hypothetical protein
MSLAVCGQCAILVGRVVGVACAPSAGFGGTPTTSFCRFLSGEFILQNMILQRVMLQQYKRRRKSGAVFFCNMGGLG